MLGSNELLTNVIPIPVFWLILSVLLFIVCSVYISQDTIFRLSQCILLLSTAVFDACNVVFDILRVNNLLYFNINCFNSIDLIIVYYPIVKSKFRIKFVKIVIKSLVLIKFFK